MALVSGFCCCCHKFFARKSSVNAHALTEYLLIRLLRLAGLFQESRVQVTLYLSNDTRAGPSEGADQTNIIILML